MRSWASLADEAHKVIDSTGWGLRLRSCQWLFACIITSLAAFIFSKFESWKWAPIIIAFGGWLAFSLPLVMIFGRIYQTLWVQSFKLGLEWMSWAMSLLILEGFSYTISKDKVCVSTDRDYERSPECDAVYVGVAFAGFVMLAVIREYKESKNRERLPSANHEPATA